MLSLRARGLRFIMRRAKPKEERTLEEDRENFKKISGNLPATKKVSCEKMHIGEIPCLRFIPELPKNGQHILYLSLIHISEPTRPY